MVLHRHHITPKHAGGSDDPSNLLLCTPEVHAYLHRVLYGKYNRWQDKLAADALGGYLKKQDIILKACSEGGKKANRLRWSKQENIDAQSELQKSKWKDEEFRSKTTQSMIDCWDDDKRKAETSARSIKMWSDDNIRSQISQSNKKSWEDVSLREAASNNKKEYFSNDENRERHSKACTKRTFIGTCKSTGKVIKLNGSKALSQAGFSHSHVFNCCSGKRKSHKGYTWYLEGIQDDKL